LARHFARFKLLLLHFSLDLVGLLKTHGVEAEEGLVGLEITLAGQTFFLEDAAEKLDAMKVPPLMLRLEAADQKLGPKKKETKDERLQRVAEEMQNSRNYLVAALDRFKVNRASNSFTLVIHLVFSTFKCQQSIINCVHSLNSLSSGLLLVLPASAARVGGHAVPAGAPGGGTRPRRGAVGAGRRRRGHVRRPHQAPPQGR
jgi:hypothetical protein